MQAEARPAGAFQRKERNSLKARKPKPESFRATVAKTAPEGSRSPTALTTTHYPRPSTPPLPEHVTLQAATLHTLPRTCALIRRACWKWRSARLARVGGRELEEQVGGLGLEGDVANLVDDQQRDAAEPVELILETPGVVSVGEPGDPLGSGRERDPVPSLAGPDAQPVDRCVLPVGSRNTTLSFAVTKSRVLGG